jgi:hypothetical protein
VSAESFRAAVRPITFRAGLRLLALVLVASCSFASSWIIVRKDGLRVECDSPFIIVNGAYTFLGKNGEPQSLPVDEVDAAKTDAVNSGVVDRNGVPVAVNLPVVSGPPTGDFLVTFKPPFPRPPAPSWSALGLQPSQERFSVHVPSSYTGREPFGLLVYIDSKEHNDGVPAGWSAILNEKKLLFVAAQGSGDARRTSRRLGLAVLGALGMKRLYNVDPARVYAAGFSGGARMASELAFYDPDLIQGAILNSGAEFYERVPQVRATSMVDTQANRYGHSMVKLPPKRMAVVRRRMRFALITGSRDFRRGNILDIYYGGYLARSFRARLFDVEGMGHETCGAPTLAQVIDFLER